MPASTNRRERRAPLGTGLALALLALSLGMVAFSFASLVLPGADALPDRPSLLLFLIVAAVMLTYPLVGTLLVAALFQPIRRRVQAPVDRRFNRARVDAEVTAAAFAERLRDVVEINAVAADLARTIDQTVKPTAQGLWLRGAP